MADIGCQIDEGANLFNEQEYEKLNRDAESLGTQLGEKSPQEILCALTTFTIVNQQATNVKMIGQKEKMINIEK